MTTPQIKVRLTPEGVSEVVAALRKVQQEGARAARKTGEPVGLLNAALTDLKALLPTLGLAAAAAGVIALGRNALRTADEIGKMAQAAGTSSENMSVLAFGAQTADVSNEQLRTGLGKLARSLGDLKRGTPEVADAFDQLGLAAADFENLDTAQAFDLIASRLAKLPDGVEKTDIALRLFGR